MKWDMPEHWKEQYIEDLKKGVTDCYFHDFRCLNGLEPIIENKTELFMQRWEIAKTLWPALDSVLEKISAIDSIGNPPLRCEIDGFTLSPTMANYAYQAAVLHATWNDLSTLRIVEIGAGFGGLIAVLKIVHPNQLVTIYDIPEALALQDRFFQTAGCCQYITYNSEPTGQCSHDLVFSFCALSEFDAELRNSYAQNVLTKTPKGLIQWNFGYNQLSAEDAIRWIQGHIPHATTLEQIGCHTSIKAPNWFLVWTDET